MATGLTVLIMAIDKTHLAINDAMKHIKYGIVEVYPLNKIQRQATTFYTINIMDAPFNSFTEARAFILQPIFKKTPLVFVDPNDKDNTQIKRRRYEVNPAFINDEESALLLKDRHLNLTWGRAVEILEDTTDG